MVRRITLAILVPILTLTLSGVAQATPPEHGTFDNGFNSFVDPEVCAAAPWQFDVNATEHEYGFYTVLFDQDGNLAKVIVHLNYDGTISANGITLVERDTWTFIYNADGTAQDVGLTVHIQGPGGIVVRDAGQIVYNPDGSVNYIRGPHEQFSGVSFCPALTPLTAYDTFKGGRWRDWWPPSERLTSPLTVRSDLGKRRSAQR